MRKIVKKFSTILVLMLIVSIITAGCGTKKEETKSADNKKEVAKKTEKKVDKKEPSKNVKPTEIKFAYWASVSEQKNYEFMAKGISEKYPDVKVDLQQYPTTEEFWTYLPAAIAANTAPDVIAFTDEGNLEYIVNGLIEPLNDLMDKVNFDKSKITKSLWKGWTYEGKIYGVPRDAATSMLVINKKMFKEAGLTKYPETMDELAKDAKAMTKDGVKGICANIHEFHITQYVHAFGGDWNFGKTINSPENIKGV